MDEVIDLKKLSDEQAIQIAMRVFKMDRAMATFYVAFIKKEIDGDIVESGENKGEHNA